MEFSLPQLCESVATLAARRCHVSSFRASLSLDLGAQLEPPASGREHRCVGSKA